MSSNRPLAAGAADCNQHHQRVVSRFTSYISQSPDLLHFIVFKDRDDYSRCAVCRLPDRRTPQSGMEVQGRLSSIIPTSFPL